MRGKVFALTEMTFWLPQAEATLEGVEGRCSSPLCGGCRMNWQMLQSRFARGRQPWLVVALLLALVLGAQTAAATECHRETPLPAEGAGASTQHDVGRWHITPDELFCR